MTLPPKLTTLASLARTPSTPIMPATLSSHTSALSGTYLPTPVQVVNYGLGSVSTLPELIRKLAPPSDGESSQLKVLIVTGNSLQDKTPVIADIRTLLEKENIASVVFAGIGQHAPIAGIKEAVNVVLTEKVSLLVSVGGGSPIDAAKAISYFVKEQTKSDTFIPQIAIPTTLSAAELTMNAGYTSEQGDKTGVADAQIVPKAIIYDALLSLHTPPTLWLSTGIRALDHALESLYRSSSQLPLKHLALASTHELFTCLPLSRSDPKNVEVRQRLFIAAWESLWLNTVPTAIGLSHALGHKIGATWGVPHGICSCLTLAPTLAYLATTFPSESWGLASLASALPFIPAEYRSEAKPAGDKEAAEEVAAAVQKLVKELGFGEKGLKDWGVTEEGMQKVAEGAAAGLKGWEGVGSAEEVRKGVLEKFY